MTIRTPHAFIPYVLAAAFAASGALWHAGDRVAGLGRATANGTASVGGPFRLVDQTGTTRTDADFRGRFMLVYFGYTFCPDVCPTTLAVMAQALAQLGPRSGRIVPIFITVDPRRDTPSVLRTYLKSFGPSFVGLTGNARDAAAAAQAYRVFARKRLLPGGTYSVDHSSVIYLMGPNGKFLDYFDEAIGPETLAAELNRRL